MRLFLLAGLAGALVLPGSATAKTDFSRQAYNILPPGQAGVLPTVPNSTDQIPMYDGLTPLFGSVTAQDIPRYFKSAKFGLGTRAVKSYRPRRGVKIVRDTFGVPHINGKTRSDVFFGAGWATAEDRGLFLELVRYPARIAALDVPGQSALGLATSLRDFRPSRSTERTLAKQVSAFVKRPGG